MKPASCSRPRTPRFTKQKKADATAWQRRRPDLQVGRSFANRKEFTIRAEVPPLIDERRRGKDRRVQAVGVQQLELRSRLHDERFSFIVGEEDLAVDGNWRRGKSFAHRV